MRRLLHITIALLLFINGWVMVTPCAGEPKSGEWIDQITALVLEHQEFAKLEGREAAYDPYLAQLRTARRALNQGDVDRVYVAMNRFMDMLEHDPEGAGIAAWSAKTIFDFCGKVTPPMYHDFSRHAQARYM